MMSEDRVRQLLSAEADTYQPSDDGMRRVRQRVEARRRARLFRRIAVASVAAAVAAIVVPLLTLNRQPIAGRVHTIAPASSRSSASTTTTPSVQATPNSSTAAPPITTAPPTTAAPPTTVAAGDVLSSVMGFSDEAVQGWNYTGLGLGTFSDSNSTRVASDFTATIDWGDGTPGAQGTDSATSGGSFGVTGSHTYTGTGTFNVIVTVTDQASSGASVTITGTVDVLPEGNVVDTTSFGAAHGTSFTGQLATFASPPRLPSQFTATIDWGDGTSSAGTIGGIGPVFSGGTYTAFTVSGTHTYAQAGTYTVTVTVTDIVTSATASGTTTATVS